MGENDTLSGTFSGIVLCDGKTLDDLLMPITPIGMQTVSEEPFRVDNDEKAEWALKKILARRRERDRLLQLIRNETMRLETMRKEAEDSCDNDTNWLEAQLEQYMDSVECRKLKSMKKYQLLSGTLVKKYGGIEWKRDDEKLVRWLEFHDRGDMIKRTAAPRWSDLKKTCEVAGDVVVDKKTGEVIDGITVETKPDSFVIEEARE